MNPGTPYPVTPDLPRDDIEDVAPSPREPFTVELLPRAVVRFWRENPNPYVTPLPGGELYAAGHVCRAAVYRGEVVAVGYRTRSGHIGGLQSILPGAGALVLDALRGRTLDCLGSGLMDYYTRHGYRVIESAPWDDALAPAEWPYPAGEPRPNWYLMERIHA